MLIITSAGCGYLLLDSLVLGFKGQPDRGVPEVTRQALVASEDVVNNILGCCQIV